MSKQSNDTGPQYEADEEEEEEEELSTCTALPPTCDPSAPG